MYNNNQNVYAFLFEGRTIRGGGENSPKKIRAKKNAWKKNSCSHYVREKKIVQANSKV
jgi:hypothetical protein